MRVRCKKLSCIITPSPLPDEAVALACCSPVPLTVAQALYIAREDLGSGPHAVEGSTEGVSRALTSLTLQGSVSVTMVP